MNTSTILFGISNIGARSCMRLYGDGLVRKRMICVVPKGVELVEGQVCPDHIHMCLNISPKHCISSIVGFLKGKSAIRLNKEFSKAKSAGNHFWIRGNFVSTVDLNEKAVRENIKRDGFVKIPKLASLHTVTY